MKVILIVSRLNETFQSFVVFRIFSYNFRIIMRFQIPQFIDVEDKIFGPFTLKQFIYMAGGASVAVVAVMFFGAFFGLVVSAPIVILAAALAFYKVNNRPFVNILESAFRYTIKDKLYIWKKKEPDEESTPSESSPSGKYSSLVVPNLSGNKLKDMNWELDVKKKESETLSNSLPANEASGK